MLVAGREGGLIFKILFLVFILCLLSPQAQVPTTSKEALYTLPIFPLI